MFIHELTSEECHKELARADFGRLACSRQNEPYVVPVNVVFDRGTVYSFSMLGRKIEWMRANPLVCLEVDRIRNANDWTSVLVFGHYEELRDPEDQTERQHAHRLLQERAMWWEPGAATLGSRDTRGDETPIYFRISIDRVTGRRAVPGS